MREARPGQGDQELVLRVLLLPCVDWPLGLHGSLTWALAGVAVALGRTLRACRASSRCVGMSIGIGPQGPAGGPHKKCPSDPGSPDGLGTRCQNMAHCCKGAACIGLGPKICHRQTPCHRAMPSLDPGSDPCPRCLSNATQSHCVLLGKPTCSSERAGSKRPRPSWSRSLQVHGLNNQHQQGYPTAFATEWGQLAPVGT